MPFFYPRCGADLGTDSVVKHNELFLLGKVRTASVRLVYLRADMRPRNTQEAGVLITGPGG